MNSEELTESITPIKDRLQQLGVRKLGIFGSLARDEATSNSDADVLVNLENHTFDAYMEIKELLEQTFGRKVDLVLDNTVKPALRPVIEKDVVHASGL